MKKALIHISAMTGGFLAALPLPALAQADSSGLPKITPDTGGNQQSIIDAIGSVVDWMLILAGALAVAYLIYGGIVYITGGAAGAENAKKIIINAIIGVVVILLAYILVNAVIGLLGGSGTTY